MIKGAVAADELDRFWAEVESAIETNPDLTFSLFGQILKNHEVRGQVLKDGQVLRIVDLEDHVPLARDLMLAPPVTTFLSAYYDDAPTAIQTLTYKFSSQQGAHSDMHLVSPPTVGQQYFRESLTAAWFACEDADERNGALIIYPGSHRLLKKPLQSFPDYASWTDYLDRLCRDSGCMPEVFQARKGDILFWHGDLVHAGGGIQDYGRTRKSFVVHYARVHEAVPSQDPSRRKRQHLGGWYYEKATRWPHAAKRRWFRQQLSREATT